LGLASWQALAFAQGAEPYATATPPADPQPSASGAVVVTAPFASQAEANVAPPAAADPPPIDPSAVDAPTKAVETNVPDLAKDVRDEAPPTAADPPPSDPAAVDVSVGADETNPPDLTPAVPGAFGDPSGAVTKVAAWVVATDDNGALPFLIIDKVAANILVFDADGRLQGVAPVLVGLARGDDSAAGVGDRRLSAIKPDERTTPAGRFVAKFGAAAGDRKVLWVDWADAISLHPVVTSNPKEHRLQRIGSPAPEDHRISYGCINVPAAFYDDVVLKAFAGGSAVVYILPDTKPLEAVFPGVVSQSIIAQQDASPINAEGQGPEPALPPVQQASADAAADPGSEPPASPEAALPPVQQVPADAAADPGSEPPTGPDPALPPDQPRPAEGASDLERGPVATMPAESISSVDGTPPGGGLK